MKPKVVLILFNLLFVLIVISTAAPGVEWDLSSGAKDDGRIVQLLGSNNADENDGGAVGDEGIDGEDKRDNGVKNDSLDENEKLSNENEKETVTDRSIDGGSKDNEVQDSNRYTTEGPISADQKNDAAVDKPIEDDDTNLNEESIHGDQKKEEISGDENSSKVLSAENKSVDDKATEQDENDGKSPSQRYREYRIRKTCKGDITCMNDFMGISETPGFLFSQDEIKKFKIWPEAVIPYYIDDLSYDKVLRDEIRYYLDDARALTGLTFEEIKEVPEGDERWVFFVNRRGQLDCKDYNTNSFTNKGVQKVIVGYDCLKHGGPMAAIVLALAGVPPQHNSPDRDRYIKVMSDNILPEKRGLFKRLKDSEWLYHGLGYDYDSVSHYTSHKYTAFGNETIELVKPKENVIHYKQDNSWMIQDEKRTYSFVDVFKIRSLYNYIIHEKPKGIKPENCKALYRPGPSYANFQLKKKKQRKIQPKPKPKKYLDAVKKETMLLIGKVKDFEGEQLSSLE